MNGRDLGKLIASIALCEGAGGIGSIFTVNSIPTWYAMLEKPPFTPPNSVFGPVWITLYLLMGISVFLLWRRGVKEPGVMPAFIVFWVQLAVNVLWSVVFFGFQSIVGGVALVAALWLLILLTIILSFRVSKLAASMLIPYVAWVSVATYLNIGIWMLNA
jgi:translocator protein